jgi:hypothetical protein
LTFFDEGVRDAAPTRDFGSRSSADGCCSRAAPPALSNPGWCAQLYPNANCQNHGAGNVSQLWLGTQAMASLASQPALASLTGRYFEAQRFNGLDVDHRSYFSARLRIA